MSEPSALPAIAPKPLPQRLFYYLLNTCGILASASLPLIGWFYAGVGDGKWQGVSKAWDFHFAGGSWSFSVHYWTIYWPGLMLLLAVVLGYIAIGWLALRLYRRSCTAAETQFSQQPVFWPLIHSGLMLLALAGLLSDSNILANDMSFYPYLLVVGLAALVLAIAFVLGLALRGLWRGNLLFWYIVWVLIFSGLQVTVAN